MSAADPDVRGPMIRIPTANGDSWVHVDCIAAVNPLSAEGMGDGVRIWERGTSESNWLSCSLTVDQALSLIERASR